MAAGTEWFVCSCIGGWAIGRSDMPFEVLVYGVSGVILVFKPGYSNQGKILCYYNESLCFDKPCGQGFLRDSVSAINL